MRAWLSGLFLSAAVLAMPAMATAPLQTAIFRTSTSGTDVSGVFGVPGRVFDAAPTTLRFYFDATPGKVNPVYRTRLEVFGEDISFVPTQSSYNLYPWDIHDGPVFRAAYEAGDPNGAPYRALDFMGVAHGVPPWFLISFVDFNIYGIEPAPLGVTEQAFGSGSDSGLSRYQIVNYVPEPATWAMMIAGFGLVGAVKRQAMRRRKRATA